LRITYLKLKNFSAIKTGMSKLNIEIDFSKCKNTISLIVGPNGSGKTALLSTLHPFAYPGGMDVRSNTNMIIDNENGMKEIHYDHNGTKYEIVHTYKRQKKGLLVKSFISRDGLELNPNGNVTSFNEIVFNEMGLQMEYLKVLRLGSNISSLIEMKGSERKASTTMLFGELDMWLDLYKKVNEDNRTLKNLLMTVNSKLQRLNVSDKDELKSQIDNIDNIIKLTNDNRDTLKQKLGSIEGSIKTLIPEGVSEYRDRLNKLIISRDELYSKLKTIEKHIDNESSKLIICGEISSEIETISNDITKYEKVMVELVTLKDSYMSLLNSDMGELENINRELTSSKTDDEIEDLKSLIKTIRMKMDTIPRTAISIRDIYTKDNMMLAINILREIDSVANGLYEFGYDAVRKCINIMRDGKSINDTINKEIVKLDEKIDAEKLKKSSNINNMCMIMYRPIECGADKCPYVDFYNKITSTDDSDNISISSLEKKKSDLLNVSNVYTNIGYIMRILRTNANIANQLKSLKIDYMDISHILDAIYNNRSIFDEAVLTAIIERIEDRDEYLKLESELKSVELELAHSKSNSSAINILEKNKRILKDKIRNNKKLIKSTTIKINELTDKIRMLNNTLEHMKDFNNYMIEHERISNDIDDISDTINSMNDKLQSIDSHIHDIELITSQIEEYDNRIDKLNAQIFDLRYRLKSYNTLVKERQILTERFEEVAMTNEALSSTKGIPLLMVQLYLQGATLFVNNILSTVCDNFEICGFNINENGFTIPYIKNGVEIEDVISASQGERSFLALALSFALINRSIKDYNIILLDEIDATLDIRNRATFINVLTQMIEQIGSEQVFMITHNNMFDSYPVDIIMTTNVNLDSYKNANIIYKG
jgi:DNA repair exonuclease SbcCD ATPase subunit